MEKSKLVLFPLLDPHVIKLCEIFLKFKIM